MNKWELTKEDIKEILSKMEETGATTVNLDISLDEYCVSGIDFDLWKEDNFITTAKELF